MDREMWTTEGEEKTGDAIGLVGTLVGEGTLLKAEGTPVTDVTKPRVTASPLQKWGGRQSCLPHISGRRAPIASAKLPIESYG